jgi:hypothetical protein
MQPEEPGRIRPLSWSRRALPESLLPADHGPPAEGDRRAAQQGDRCETLRNPGSHMKRPHGREL